MAPLVYFAYGSNLDPTGMAMRAPESVRLREARLLDWRLTFRGVADIEPADGDEVLGGLWLLTAEDAYSIDAYEGAPNFYSRIPVRVEVRGVGTVNAFTYRMTDVYQGDLGLPSAGYLQTIVDGYRCFGLPRPALRASVRRVREEHEELQIRRYRRRGAKRMMAVIEGSSSGSQWEQDRRNVRTYGRLIPTDLDTRGMSPATRRLYELEAQTEL